MNSMNPLSDPTITATMTNTKRRRSLTPPLIQRASSPSRQPATPKKPRRSASLPPTFDPPGGKKRARSDSITSVTTRTISSHEKSPPKKVRHLKKEPTKSIDDGGRLNFDEQIKREAEEAEEESEAEYDEIDEDEMMAVREGMRWATPDSLVREDGDDWMGQTDIF